MRASPRGVPGRPAWPSLDLQLWCVARRRAGGQQQRRSRRCLVTVSTRREAAVRAAWSTMCARRWRTLGRFRSGSPAMWEVAPPLAWNAKRPCWTLRCETSARITSVRRPPRPPDLPRARLAKTKNLLQYARACLSVTSSVPRFPRGGPSGCLWRSVPHAALPTCGAGILPGEDRGAGQRDRQP